MIPDDDEVTSQREGLNKKITEDSSTNEPIVVADDEPPQEFLMEGIVETAKQAESYKAQLEQTQKNHDEAKTLLLKVFFCFDLFSTLIIILFT